MSFQPYIHGVSSLSPILVAFSLLAVLVYLQSAIGWRKRSRGRPLPPGPKGLPLVGNVHNAPRFKPWIGYRDLCAQYGDIVHVQILNTHIVVLGSPEVIFEYLDKRSANTSDREHTVMLELTGAHWNFSFMYYGPWWRRHRRTMWQYFHPGAVEGCRPVQRAEAHRFLYKLFKDPANFKKHIRYTSTASMTKVVYDIEGDDKIERQVTLVHDAQEGVAQGLVPGKYLVQFFPFLRYVPAWFPGAEFKRLSNKWRAAAWSAKYVPYGEVKETLKGRSMVGQLLTKLARAGLTEEARAEEEDVISNVASVAFQGARHTFSTFTGAFVALSLHPEVLRKAHAELDAVVGPDRLPDFSDRASLIYVNALIKEMVRWHNSTPLSLPHATIEDDELHGYFIPAGTVVFANTWACMHDPEVYDEPGAFCPERFIQDGKLDPSVRDPADYVFGYGRRICPGRHFADDMMFINMASVLHCFDIGPPLDERGRPVKIVPEWTNGLGSYVILQIADARCTITPRSAQAEVLILEAQARVPEAMARWSRSVLRDKDGVEI
ncbi:O-methylsterigmatocystin oxidoreductase [Lentinus tigrinus ALCF2SS1-7]|uniref:O-methylsterigmatocystin oxidoreductase n=1 Tax=Lentinus tigrinus ALCF2SS1-6 TaxID=1328759 RepID=A0A5C2SD86_9APHY|nr:O-methylsterigmatocystin oxidoreductase [Lentinus tigrinus ALCF2SS1-6]RPD76068.1 O-methylsterigmatocystin oxidoreductase [Lentinus tigrinus ALCF2SS1-7]